MPVVRLSVAMRSRELRRGVRLAGLLALLCLGVVATPAASSGQAPDAAACASADAALDEGKLEQARKDYLDLLASTPSSRCAAQGLQVVTLAAHAEARLCGEGKALAEGNYPLEARRLYVAALAKNVESACATAALGVSKKTEKEEKRWLESWSSEATNVDTLFGSIAVGALVLLGAVFLLKTLWRRSRRPSLAVEPFADGAVEPKVGGLVAGMVEERLIGLARQGKRVGDGYLLDLVNADVELLAGNESFNDALSGLADTSQFKLAVAVLGLIDRRLGTHLIAKGELAPQGASGYGVMLSMHSQKHGGQARGALWDTVGGGAHPPAARAARTKGGAGAAVKADPDPYYKLVDRAAAWLQYEAALCLEPDAELITRSADSFSFVAEGIAEQRAGNVDAAAHNYALALRIDGENVAALFNLGSIFARHGGDFVSGRLLQERACQALAAHHRNRP